METRYTALVVGANGVVGSNLITYLEEIGGWEIVGLSRRGGRCTNKTTYINVDLLDAEDCMQKLQHLTSVTHVFYAAYQDRPSWIELVQPNLDMLVNVVQFIESVAIDLQHISLMQGYKVYGAHYGPFKTPAKESDGGHMPPEFNVSQQQFLETAQKGKKWTWSALRPSVVGGTALGNPMNLVMVIAIYAVLSKEMGLPLRFPGKLGAYDKLLDLTDAGLLARATVWAATNSQCANQAFNITNGDLIRWNDLWPKIALISVWKRHLLCKCHCKQSWQTRKTYGTLYKINISWKNIVIRYFLPGHLVILYFPGIMISFLMGPKPEEWASTNL